MFRNDLSHLAECVLWLRFRIVTVPDGILEFRQVDEFTIPRQLLTVTIVVCDTRADVDWESLLELLSRITEMTLNERAEREGRKT